MPHWVWRPDPALTVYCEKISQKMGSQTLTRDLVCSRTMDHSRIVRLQRKILINWMRSTVAILSVCMFHARADVLDAWHSRDGGVTNDAFFGVAYGNGKFVVTGYFEPVVLTSPDGVTWTTHTIAPYAYLRGVVWGNGVFVAVGNGGRILTSPDGVSWTDRSTNGVPIYDLTYGRGTFLGVGPFGAIVQSDLLLSLKLRFTTSAELIVSGLKGRTYRLESVNDLRFGDNWSNRATITLTNSPQQWFDPESAGVRTRFYRAAWPPY